MALRTVSNTGGNWNATAAWVGGVVPLLGDTVDFTATSGNLVVNVTTTTLSGINFTNYLGIITFNANIVVNISVNLGTGGYTQAGSGSFGLTISISTTITSNGVSWNNLLTFIGNTQTYTLADNLTVNGNIVMSGTSSSTFTGNTLYIGGNLTFTTSVATVGTTSFVFNGTGTWSSTGGGVRNNLTINTTGTLTLSGNVYYQTGTLTYISGTVVTAGSVLNIIQTTTLNTSGITWNNVTITVGTQTLTSDLNCQNLTTSIASSVVINNSGGNVYILGNLLQNNNGLLLGTASINLIGTGTWSNTSTGAIRNNININTSGTLTIGTNIYYNTGTLTYIAGIIDATTNNSTLNIGATTTLDTSGMSWNNVSITFGNITFSSDLNVLNFTVNGNSNPNLNLNKINVIGNLQIDGTNTVSGTAEIILLGDGTWSSILGSNAELRNNLTINAAGTIKLSTNVYYGIGTIKYLSGKINAKNSTLNIVGNTTLINCHKINFNNVRLNVSSTITMNEFFSGSPSLVTNIISSSSTANYTIVFQDGFEKISKFVNINNCTLSKPLQLLVITKSKINSTNRGIRYINQSPNGIAKGEPSVNVPMTFGAGGLINDPNME